jgi:hypothetical protein
MFTESKGETGVLPGFVLRASADPPRGQDEATFLGQRMNSYGESSYRSLCQHEGPGTDDAACRDVQLWLIVSTNCRSSARRKPVSVPVPNAAYMAARNCRARLIP